MTRRDELLTTLRNGTPKDSDRATLEDAAARVMMQLDKAEKKLGKVGPPKKKAQLEPTAAAAPSASFLKGFAYGAGLFLLLGALMYWALRDAEPTGDTGAPPPPVAEHPASADMPPQLAAQVGLLESRLAASPDDLTARRDLSYVYLSSGQFVQAYRQAEAMLDLDPENSDGLHVQAVVRLTMGQTEQAGELLARSLAAHPRHLDSLYTSGILALQQGDYPRAISAWDRALVASPEANPQLERVLAMAREGRPAQEILGLPAAEASVASGPAYRVRIEIGPDLAAPPGAALFVSIRERETGPPAAARRIDRPSFPLEVTLTAEHSMMGQPLPESGILSVRLDADGNASTQGPDDVSSRTAARLGGIVTIHLGN